MGETGDGVGGARSGDGWIPRGGLNSAWLGRRQQVRDMDGGGSRVGHARSCHQLPQAGESPACQPMTGLSHTRRRSFGERHWPLGHWQAVNCESQPLVSTQSSIDAQQTRPDNSKTQCPRTRKITKKQPTDLTRPYHHIAPFPFGLLYCKLLHKEPGSRGKKRRRRDSMSSEVSVFSVWWFR